MRLVSTRGEAPPVPARRAISSGPAPDGGLYLPADLPRLDGEELRGIAGAGWPDAAARMARVLLSDECEAPELGAIVRDALDFPVPVRPVGERIRVLELFHGPTLAFKDLGARVLARSVASLRRASGSEPPTVLVATSGDTGSAVGDAFRRLSDAAVVVLYPAGRIGERQERHLTRLGGNVTAVAVDGSFDDCQALARRAFADRELRERARLVSANSINVGRLLPQIPHYFRLTGPAGAPEERAAGERTATRRGEADGRSGADDLLVSVPSGNLGHLTAGLMAKRMGLPVDRFVAATNRNDVLPRYLETGRPEPRTAVSTPSSAMDVGDPSNLERIRHLYGDRARRLRQDVTAVPVGDGETLATIARVHRRHGYLLDPHTAVGWAALERELEHRPEAEGVVLATAHPAKFREVVAPLVDGTVPVPERWARALEGDGRRREMEPEPDALRDLLLGGR